MGEIIFGVGFESNETFKNAILSRFWQRVNFAFCCTNSRNDDPPPNPSPHRAGCECVERSKSEGLTDEVRFLATKNANRKNKV